MHAMNKAAEFAVPVIHSRKKMSTKPWNFFSKRARRWIGNGKMQKTTEERRILFDKRNSVNYLLRSAQRI